MGWMDDGRGFWLGRWLFSGDRPTAGEDGGIIVADMGEWRSPIQIDGMGTGNVRCEMWMGAAAG